MLLEFINIILDINVEIYHQTAISPRHQFLRLLDDPRIIIYFELTPYSVRLRCGGGGGKFSQIWWPTLIVMISQPSTIPY